MSKKFKLYSYYGYNFITKIPNLFYCIYIPYNVGGDFTMIENTTDNKGNYKNNDTLSPVQDKGRERS